MKNWWYKVKNLDRKWWLVVLVVLVLSISVGSAFWSRKTDCGTVRRGRWLCEYVQKPIADTVRRVFNLNNFEE